MIAIERIVSDNPIETLHAVFELWMEKVESISQDNGDYDP
jgi:hypothetical protein